VILVDSDTQSRHEPDVGVRCGSGSRPTIGGELLGRVILVNSDAQGRHQPDEGVRCGSGEPPYN